MKYNVDSVEAYVEAVPEKFKASFDKLRGIIKQNIPEGFKEELNYGMLGYVVPLSRYPQGYHCDTTLPLPFANLAAQKNFIGVYHMGIYSDPELLQWFQSSYSEICKYKLDMGKSCIRLKRMDDIPYELIAELFQKITVDEWIDIYEEAQNRRKS